jgi:ligand-binding sensor domain-containing protein
MQSLFFRILGAVITLLLLAALILVVVLTMRTEHVAIPTATPRPLPTATASPTTTANQKASGEDNAAPSSGTISATVTIESIAIDLPDGFVRVVAGGFAYRSEPSFSASRSDTSATLTGVSTSGDLAPIFLLSSGARDQFVDSSLDTLDEAFDHFVTFFAEQDGFDIDNRQMLEIDAMEARSVDLVSNDIDNPYTGRIVMAELDNNRLFVLTGVAPQDEWQRDAAQQFDDVLASVSFFPPGESSSTSGLLMPTTAPTSTPLPTVPPTPTPIPPSVPLPTPNSDADVGKLPAIYSNANFIHEVDLANNTLWAAGEGGIVAWNLRSGGSVKFTAAQGLQQNHFDTVTTCPLPGLGVVFGGAQGLQIFDARNGIWNTLTSANSAMSYDDVATVRCYPDQGFLVVGYRQHGLDIFDAGTNVWEHLDKADGLDNDFVEQVAVVGDREEVWVSSGFGLTVLSAARPLYYNTANSPLTSNQIDALVATEDGVVWIGGPGALHEINDGQWTAYTAETVDGRFPSGTITGLDVDDDGLVWLSSDAGEICSFDPNQRQCVQFFQNEPGMPVAPYTYLTIGPEANVYVSTLGGGLAVFDGSSWQTMEVAGELTASNQIRDLAETVDGFIWIANDLGVQQMSPADPAIQRLYTLENGGIPIDDVRVLAPDAGGIWIGGLGAAYFDGSDWQVFMPVDGLAGSVVQAMAIDSQLRAWIGTKTGLSIWNGDIFFNLTQENGLPSDNITALLADDDAMWIGTSGGGLFYFMRNQLQIFSDENADLPSNTITALGRDGDGTLLVGTSDGLVRFADGVASPVDDVPALPITAIASMDQLIWVGTDGAGVYYFDGNGWIDLADDEPLPSMQIEAILADKYETIWVGGERGGISRLESE